MPESYPVPTDRPSPAPPPPTSGLRSSWQFSLAGLLFWLTMSAVGAGVVKMFLDRGHRGVDYLLVYMALGIWLAVTWIAILLRVYAPRRWQKAAALRREMEQLLSQRRSDLTRSSDGHDPALPSVANGHSRGDSAIAPPPPG